MEHPPFIINTAMWDAARAEEQLVQIIKQYEQFRDQLPEETLTQTTLILDGLYTVKSRIATVKYSLIPLARQEE